MIKEYKRGINRNEFKIFQQNSVKNEKHLPPKFVENYDD